MITIGSRKSKLAMWQSERVAALLARAKISSTIVSMETIGDRKLDSSIAKIGSKGVFTAELEEQLVSGQTDIAVHSAKDMQSVLPEGFELIAFTVREKVHDVLLSSKKVDIDTERIVIGTSSVRRKAFLRHYYPHVELVEMRGNLQTRIAKMEAGVCDALMLAYAGVVRMGYEALIVKEFDISQIIPPVGQGCIAVEAAVGLDILKKEGVRAAVNNYESEICLSAERAFLKKLEGGCSIPAFGHASFCGDTLTLSAGLASLDGAKMICRSEREKITDPAVPVASDLGDRIGEYILNNGGRELLRDITLQQQQ